MNYTKSTKTVIPTPATATEELHERLVIAITLHYTKILTPELLIAHRKGCYAVIINSTWEGSPIEYVLGSANAKVLTEQVLNNLLADISTIPADI